MTDTENKVLADRTAKEDAERVEQARKYEIARAELDALRAGNAVVTPKEDVLKETKERFRRVIPRRF